MAEQADAISRLKPCAHRKGTRLNNRMILSCNGFEVTIDECDVCRGIPKTKMTLGQTLNQKWNEMKTTINWRHGMELMTNDQIAARLDIGSKDIENRYKTKIMVYISAAIILITAGIYVYLTYW